MVSCIQRPHLSEKRLKTESETSNKLIQNLLFCHSDFKLEAKTCCVQKKKKKSRLTPLLRWGTGGVEKIELKTVCQNEHGASIFFSQCNEFGQRTQKFQTGQITKGLGFFFFQIHFHCRSREANERGSDREKQEGEMQTDASTDNNDCC